MSEKLSDTRFGDFWPNEAAKTAWLRQQLRYTQDVHILVDRYTSLFGEHWATALQHIKREQQS